MIAGHLCGGSCVRAPGLLPFAHFRVDCFDSFVSSLIDDPQPIRLINFIKRASSADCERVYCSRAQFSLT